MPNSLARHIRQLRVVNTHEHQRYESNWVNEGPADLLQDLFNGYEVADFIAAGLDQPELLAARDAVNKPIEERWARISPWWDAIRFTGYGEAVRLHAKHLYNIDHITGKALRDAQPKLDAYRKPGQRLHILRDIANLDHVQVDHFVWPALPDKSGPDFFLYDLSMFTFVLGEFDPEAAFKETGVQITDLETLRAAMSGLFDKYGKTAIAVKTQHAYGRTIGWTKRDDASAAASLAAVLKSRKDADPEVKKTIGDWCMERVCELCAKHNLPLKIHTGYHAGVSNLRLNWINPALLSDLILAHQSTRFVLMHIGYPYDREITAMAKNLRNVWVDLCWAWSIDPYSSLDFVRRCIHTVPLNKIFGYGGDTFTPTKGAGYALQMRKWFTRALDREVEAGDLTEAEAIDVANRYLRENQLAVFDVEGKRKAIQQALAANSPTL